MLNIRNLFKRLAQHPASKIDRLTYAIGDVHGMFSHFCALLERIRMDARSLGLRPRVILLGDYIDRGSGSANVLNEILRMETYSNAGKGWCDLEALTGNHEQAMLDFLAGRL